MAEIDHQILNNLINDASSFLYGCRDVFALLGLVYASKLTLVSLYKILRTLKVYLLPKIWHCSDFKSRYGNWAVVTGASEGIGRSYAFKLAQRKMNIFLISRTESKLEKVAEEIQNLYPDVKVSYLALDMSELMQDSVYNKLENALSGLDIGVLVNNVGVMYERLQNFLTVPKERLIEIVDVNITATVLMTYMVLPSLVEKGKGAIINVASGASVHPTPMMTHYSASKKFVDAFTRALEYEYRSCNITMQAVQPFYVSSKITHHAKPNMLVLEADDYVDSAIKTLGFTRRTYGQWFHGVFGFFGELMPESFYMFCATYINRPLWSFLCNVKTDTEKLKKES